MNRQRNLPRQLSRRLPLNLHHHLPLLPLILLIRWVAWIQWRGWKALPVGRVLTQMN